MAKAAPSPTFVVDTSVFTQANRQYYPFDICPGFWDCLLHHAQSSMIISIDRVKDEIKAGNDDVTKWSATSAPNSFFASTSDPGVITEFSAMMQWVQANSQFLAEAKTEFAKVADGWVVAYAKTHNLTLVTQEVYAPGVKKRVPLPNVCKEFGVACASTYDMLRALGVSLIWTPPT